VYDLWAWYCQEIEQIPLSYDTIRTYIYDKSNDIKQQVIAAIKTGRQFSIQLDETTDVSNDTQLMGYVRYPGLTYVEE
jgi:hypothetical protein